MKINKILNRHSQRGIRLCTFGLATGTSILTVASCSTKLADEWERIAWESLVKPYPEKKYF
ncbi:MAG: hypothetical protein LBG28_09000 [Tannerella sp.]|jgi:hypothetical protein|nr:hypothetical protein [Tannerella sp.]